MTDRATAAYQRGLDRLRRSTVASLQAAHRTHGDDYVNRAVDLVLSSQRATVRLTDAYVSAYAGAATGTTTAPAGIDPEAIIGAHARNGTALEAVYQRAAATTADVARAALTDLQLAARNASTARLAADRRVVGYRRVLSLGGNHCGLCVVASTQRYHKADLMPIHPHCGCTVQPILATGSTGRVIDQDRLDATLTQLGSNSYTQANLGRLRLDADRLPSSIDPAALPDVDVVWHGEYGPLLWNSAHVLSNN